ncbi:hypothetical protein DPMN_155875 [Dreissena polymorpha]|uniref:G-protein coupled receptors family 1 profile domain-containing protein n=1 Tax=Dreissena polymorpha TaxID=45954 RepID=A0A9D4FUI7_DREPO|nr:hypothetical protein DPMN_155875 [Dreissena polymorpha]
MMQWISSNETAGMLNKTFSEKTTHANENDIYTENYSFSVKLVYVLLDIMSVIPCFLSIQALQKAKKFPESAKFLVTALLCFDSSYILIASIRKFVLETFANTNLYTLSLCAGRLALLTAAIMAVERVFVFYKPYAYIRTCTRNFIRTVSVCAWLTELCIFYGLRYGYCYLRFQSKLVFEQAGLCNGIMTVYYVTFSVAVLVTFALCYWKILRIIQRKYRQSDERRLSFKSTFLVFRQFKSTTFVFTHSLFFFLFIFAYIFLLILARFNKLNVTELRLSVEGISICVCLLDPIVYVLWFKECRMGILDMFSFLGDGVRTKVAKMRLEIYDIEVFDRCKIDSEITNIEAKDGAI